MTHHPINNPSNNNHQTIYVDLSQAMVQESVHQHIDETIETLKSTPQSVNIILNVPAAFNFPSNPVRHLKTILERFSALTNIKNVIFVGGIGMSETLNLLVPAIHHVHEINEFAPYFFVQTVGEAQFMIEAINNPHIAKENEDITLSEA